MPPHDRDPLSLDEQICFALAVASRDVIAEYRTVLEPLGLTHPQYLVMLALWERERVPLRELADRLHLEPATLSPLLKRLEAAGLVSRTRGEVDDRALSIALTDAGRALRREALTVPPTMVSRLGLGADDLEELNRVLRRLLGRIADARTAGALA
ncbi:MAG: MarR family transcriptional regulator [Actinomycetales bacterium]|nr:MAG: MarR family transcriptional regulator [Actinomycetales bacterium]